MIISLLISVVFSLQSIPNTPFEIQFSRSSVPGSNSG